MTEENDATNHTVILPPANVEDFSNLTERQMLERILRENASLSSDIASVKGEIQEIKERLSDGDQRFSVGDKREKQHEMDWTSAMRFLKSVNLRMARRDPAALAEAQEIEDAISARFPPNGSVHEVPTNPDNERPDTEPSFLE